MNLLKTFSLLALFISCQEKFDLDSCTELYAKAYRGHPNSAHLYKKNCVPKNLIPKFNCQAALEKLMVGANKELLEKAFGPHVMKCFTERDMNNFLKSRKN